MSNLERQTQSTKIKICQYFKYKNELLLFKAKWTIFQLYHGDNKLNWNSVLVALIYINYILCTLDHFLNMHVNYGITVGLEIHKNWNNFNWKLPELLPIFTKTEILYRETGWELLSVRRKRRKLQLFYNIVNKKYP